MIDKKSLQLLIAKGKLDKVITEVIEFTQELNDDELQHDAILISDNHKEYIRAERNGMYDMKELRQMRNGVTSSLIGLVSELPDSIEIAQAKKGISESGLKRIIFLLLLIGKTGLVFWVVFQQSTGGLSRTELFGLLGLLVPIYIVYLTIIFSKGLNSRKAVNNWSRPPRKPLVWISFSVIPIYIIIFWSTINWKAKGLLSVQEMYLFLTLIESCLGIYIATVILELFRNEDVG